MRDGTVALYDGQSLFLLRLKIDLLSQDFKKINIPLTNLLLYCPNAANSVMMDEQIY